MTNENVIYINYKKKPYFRKIKRVEFDIIRKDEFETAPESQPIDSEKIEK